MPRKYTWKDPNREKTIPPDVSKYVPDMDELAYEFAKSGQTVDQIATSLGISVRCLKNWSKDHPSIWECIKRGRREHDAGPAEGSLLKRALGYEYAETTVEAIVVGVGENEKLYVETKKPVGERGYTVPELIPGIKRKITTRHVPPDVGALCFWLCNRQPLDWKNVQKQIVEGTVKHDHDHQHTLDLTKYGREDLERLRELVEKGSKPAADAKDNRHRLPARIIESEPLCEVSLAGDRA